MFDPTSFIRLYARWRTSQLQSSRPAAIQHSQLMRLLAKASATRIGSMYNFSSISSVDEYQRRVPLRTYEQFWDEFWKNDFPRLENNTWPGIIPFFPVSSGTSSGTTKYIPCSKEMLASNTKAGLDLLVHHVTNRPQSKILGGKIFLLGGSTDLTSPAPGIFSGDLSGITAKEVPWWIRSRYFPPADLSLIKNWEEKIDILAKASLTEDIRMISGVPAWLMIFFEKLKELSPQAHGRISEIYKNLEMVVHGGVNFSPYVPRFHDILQGSSAELREVYPASEGFIAVADRGYGEGLRLNLDHGIFFEFVPMEEISSPHPTRHWIANVEPDVNYAVVMTTCAGLWSYVIGDTVRFVDTQMPRVLVSGRTSYYLSAFGEHLIAEEIEDGVSTAANTIQEEIVDFTVGPIFPERAGELGGHIFLVEFAHALPSAEKISLFAQALDRRLCQRNEDYEAHRSGGFGLREPTIFALKPGCFAAWMKTRGKLGGQNKVPRIINKSEMLSTLVSFATDFNSGVAPTAISG